MFILNLRLQNKSKIEKKTMYCKAFQLRNLTFIHLSRNGFKCHETGSLNHFSRHN